MAILFLDGFQHYGPGTAFIRQGEYRRVEGVSIQPGAGRGGGAGAVVNVGANNSGLQYTTPTDTPGGGFAFQLSRLPDDGSSLCLAQMQSIEPPTFYDFSLINIMVGANGALIFKAYGKGGTVFASSEPCIMAKAFHHFEFSSRHRDRVSSVAAWIDGVEVLSGTFAFPINEPPLNTSPGRLWMGGCEGYPKDGATGMTMTLSDLVIRDAEGPVNIGRVFDGIVRTRFPDRDGALKDWKPSSGSAGYPMLNNVPPADSLKYLAAEAIGDRSSFGIAPFPDGPVRAVMSAVRYAASSDVVTVKTGILSGGSEAFSPARTIRDSPAWISQTFQTDPATSALWESASLNAALLVISRETQE